MKGLRCVERWAAVAGALAVLVMGPPGRAQTAATAPAPASAPVAKAGGGGATAAQSELDRVRAESGIPGMAAAVFVGDRIVWSGAAGMADLEHAAPVTASTKFRIGSVNKVLTATLAARLAERGVLDLDRDVREYVPTWQEKGPDKGEKVTLRLLLGHLGGVRHYRMTDFAPKQIEGSIDSRVYPDMEAALAIFKDDPLVAKPGEKYSYTTFGYTLIAAAIEKAVGKPFVEVLKTEVLEPLSLSEEIMPDDLRVIIPGRSCAYDPAEAGDGLPAGSVVRSLPINTAYKRGGGGYVATAAGIARFGAAHFDGAVFGEKVMEMMMTEQKTLDGKGIGVGLGWRVRKDEAGRRFWNHDGAQSGCRATLTVYPDQRVSVCVLSNMSNAPRDVGEVGRRIAAEFLPAGKP